MAEVGALLDHTGADWVILNITAIKGLGQMIGMGLPQGQGRLFLMTPVGQ